MIRRLAFFAMTLFISAGTASSADTATSQPTVVSEPFTIRRQTFVPFADERRWDFEILGAGNVDLSNRRTKMIGPRVALGYYLYDNIALRLELTGYSVSTEPGDTSAVQGSFGLRQHLLAIGNTSLFIDVGGGIFEAGRRVPEHGTDFNFTFHTGPGIAIPLADGLDLETGVRFFHLSNAHLEGEGRNPSINGSEFFAGLMYRL